MKLSKVVIVGASLAGLNAAETLRSMGYDGKISLIGDEKYLPYDRPPLSKQVLDGSYAAEPPYLREAEEFTALDLDLYLGCTATAVNTINRRVIVGSGDSIEFDGLLLATGAQARPMLNVSKMQGIHTLRNFNDAVSIRKAFKTCSRVVIIGGGFIGSEVASSARSLGLQVTILEALPVPLSRVLGDEMGSACSKIHSDYGTDLKCNAIVKGFDGGDHVERVRLGDGSTIDTDLVVIGIGAVPSTKWLDSSDLNIDNGVVCDEHCFTGAPGVYAAGDVARWWHPRLQKYLRVEHWSNAVEQGVIAAKNMLGDEAKMMEFVSTPYFWSQQYGMKMQFAGVINAGDRVQVVHGSAEEHDFVAIYGDGENFNAVLSLGLQRLFLGYRKLLVDNGNWAQALRLSRSDN